MSADLDEVTLVIEDGPSSGIEFKFWEEMTLSDDFLTPCQTLSLKVGVDETRFGFTSAIREGLRFQLLVNGFSQISGFIDKVSIESGRGGTFVSVTGRDTLSPVVDGNVDPRMTIAKGLTLEDLALELFAKQFKLDVDVLDTAHAHRDLSLGKPVKPGKPARRKKVSDPLKEARPHDNEGAFQYFTRLAHRAGFHAWASCDGGHVIVATPDYDQEPAYEIISRRGQTPGAAGSNMVENGCATTDGTGVPSVIRTRGKGTATGEKGAYRGYAENLLCHRYVPFYMVDEGSGDKEQVDRVARFLLSKSMRNYFTYQCTVRGLSDVATGRVWNVDTVANVTDEFCGVDGKLWMQSRTLMKSRAGTRASLSFLPLGVMLFDYPPDEDPKPAPATYVADKKPEPVAVAAEVTKKIPQFVEIFKAPPKTAI